MYLGLLFSLVNGKCSGYSTALPVNSRVEARVDINYFSPDRSEQWLLKDDSDGQLHPLLPRPQGQEDIAKLPES